MVERGKIDIYSGIVGEKDVGRPNYIEDAYEVSFYFDESYWPHVKEIGGRLDRRAKELGIDMAEMHVLASNELCLGAPRVVVTEMKKDASVRHLFQSLLIPYLYYHSYWEKHGNEPWDGLPHGKTGILEDFCDHMESAVSREVVRKTIDRLSPYGRRLLSCGRMAPGDSCFCGSGKPVKQCHPKARRGFNILFDAYSNNR